MARHVVRRDATICPKSGEITPNLIEGTANHCDDEPDQPSGHLCQNSQAAAGRSGAFHTPHDAGAKPARNDQSD